MRPGWHPDTGIISLCFCLRQKDDCFPISAAVRKSDGDLKEAIDRAWDELDRSGKLAQVFTRWHIPYEPPSRIDPKEGTGS